VPNLGALVFEKNFTGERRTALCTVS